MTRRASAAVHHAVPDDLESQETAEIVDPKGDGLSIRQAAKAAGMAESVLRRAIHDGLVKAERDGRSFRITQQTILELKAGGGLQQRRASIAARETMHERGEISAQAFALFSQGTLLVDVVQSLRQDPDVVERLWKRWIALQALHQQSLVAKCLHDGPDCEGSPRPDAMLCVHHAAHSRPLSAEQIATLDSVEIPTAVKCTSCSKMAARGLCSRCVRSLTVAVEAGRIAIRSGKELLAIVPIEGSRKIANDILGGSE